MTDVPEKLLTLRNILKLAHMHFAIFYNDTTISTVEEGEKLVSNDISKLAPTLILETEAGFLAAVISGNARLSYKKIKQQLHLKNVFLASPEKVKQVTGAEVGQVSLINPSLLTIVDIHLLEKSEVFGGCGVSNYTLSIRPQDLVTINNARVFDFTKENLDICN
ncbi:MAG TPA: hypothetical protein G4N92_00640 [Anaerolineae bacterium]|nr:hypothetical protein [Anaerolineae bacterium]